MSDTAAEFLDLHSVSNAADNAKRISSDAKKSDFSGQIPSEIDGLSSEVTEMAETVKVGHDFDIEEANINLIESVEATAMAETVNIGENFDIEKENINLMGSIEVTAMAETVNSGDKFDIEKESINLIGSIDQIGVDSVDLIDEMELNISDLDVAVEHVEEVKEEMDLLLNSIDQNDPELALENIDFVVENADLLLDSFDQNGNDDISVPVPDVHEDTVSGEPIKKEESEQKPVLDSADGDEIKGFFSGSGYVDESSFEVSDLVWAKVRKHPWWPGQIFDSSDATELALKHQKKGHLLIGCFGDKTFAWCDKSNIKPFYGSFSQLAHQFPYAMFKSAVNSALDEVSRRVELAMSGDFTPPPILKNLETQKFESAGIRKISFVNVPAKSFHWEPDKFLQSIYFLALNPLEEMGRLELTIVKAQSISFQRYRGKTQVFTPSDHDEKKVEPKSKSRSRKREKNDRFDYPEKGKKRRLNKAVDVEVKSPTVSPSFKIGERISRAASKLTGSPSNGQILQKNVAENALHEVSSLASEVTEQFSSGDLLSKLILSARNPIKRHAFLTKIIPYFTEFRKQRDAAVKKKRGRKKKVETVEESGEKTPKKRGREEKSDLSEEPKIQEEKEATNEDYMTDSYWTDRLVSPTVAEGPVMKKTKLSQGESEDDARAASAKWETTMTKTKACFGDSSPTALVLSFGESGMIPSETELCRVYSRYGPLKEGETKVDAVTKSARVVFRRRADADVAFGGTGQFGFFSPSLLSFRLESLPSMSSTLNVNDSLAPDEVKEAEAVKEAEETVQEDEPKEVNQEEEVAGEAAGI